LASWATIIDTMSEMPADKTDSVASDPPNSACDGCPGADRCRQVWSMPNRGPLTAGGLSLAGATAFLLPILTAIIAGAVAHSYLPNSVLFWQILAVVIGLIAGCLLARMIMPLIRKHFYDRTHRQENNPRY